MEWIISHWLGHINGFDVLLWTGLAVLHHYLFRQPQAAAEVAESSASQTTALPWVMDRKALRVPRLDQSPRLPRELRPEPATLRVRDAAARRAETRGRWAEALAEVGTPVTPMPRNQRLAA